MLEIVVGAEEAYDEATESFTERGGVTLRLEHSLVSLSKWESKFEKPFLSADKKSVDEVLAYVRCMSDKPIADKVLSNFSEKNFEDLNTYLNAKKTATWFSEQPGEPASNEVITSELIYYWMTVLQIDWQAQYWHLNRLFTLIRVCNVKQGKPKKMSRSEVARRNRELNEQRRKQLGTNG